MLEGNLSARVHVSYSEYGLSIIGRDVGDPSILFNEGSYGDMSFSSSNLAITHLMETFGQGMLNMVDIKHLLYLVALFVQVQSIMHLYHQERVLRVPPVGLSTFLP